MGGPQLPFTPLVAALEDRLRGQPGAWPSHWRARVPLLARELLHEEALANLVFRLGQHNLPFTPGDKTRSVLDRLLDDFSLAQVWNIIWQAATSATAWRERQGVSRAHAANAAVSTLEKRGETYRQQGGPKPGRREYDLPVPMVCHVLFVNALGLTDPPYAERILDNVTREFE